MHFHHLHFYVLDAALWRDWFVHKLGFQSALTSATEVLVQGAIEIRLSDPSPGASSEQSSLVNRYLQQHPPGLVDVAFATDRFDQVLRQAQAQTALLSEVSVDATGQRQCQLQGWADLRHTVIEVSSQWILKQQAKTAQLSAIDHAVINVPQGELAAASSWYQQLLGLVPGQRFEINTAYSGLRSQVLVHPQGTLQIPINEPSSDNSQIQEFLHHNRGAGVQHVALRSVRCGRGDRPLPAARARPNQRTRPPITKISASDQTGPYGTSQRLATSSSCSTGPLAVSRECCCKLSLSQFLLSLPFSLRLFSAVPTEKMVRLKSPRGLGKATFKRSLKLLSELRESETT